MGQILRKDVEKEGGVLARFSSDWENIHKTASALSRVSGGCITVKFYSGNSCSYFDSSGELLENNYAKKTQSREPTNIIKYTKNLKIIFSLLLILELNTQGPKIPTSHISFRRVHHKQ